VSLKPGTSLTFTPLIQSSEKAGELPSSALQFAQPDDIVRQVSPSGKHTLAALITGKFKTAFPDGAPNDAPTADADKKEPKPPTKPAAAALKESKGTSTLMVITDTDWLFDDYSVEKMNYLGQTVAEEKNDNLAFALNSMDYLSGDEDLLSIRGKGSSIRPFTVVRSMEASAEEKYKEKLDGLESKLNDIQSKLTDLQGKKGDGSKLLASPEVTKSIEDFQKQESALRAERRQIRYALTEGIGSLETKLLWINLLATPLLICVFGLWFWNARKR
jgi:ABC-type uncharacterized transport system involved in gliding motility auxiliary subunit